MTTKNKLLLFLALNAVSTSIIGATPKYDKLYNKMNKNLETGKINESNYKLLENILKQRNKELKDIYMQGDYIVKPEYLEWQVFFSGFIQNRKIKGEKETYVSYSEDKIKGVKFPMMLPIKNIEDKKIEKNISPINLPYIIPKIKEINPITMNAPIINHENFILPNTPNPSAFYMGLNRRFFSVSTGKITSNIIYNTSGNSVFENLNVTPKIETEINLQGSQAVITGITDYANGSYIGTTAATNTHSYSGSKFDVVTISNNGDFEIGGNWKYQGGWSNRLLSLISYRPYYVNTDSKVIFSGNLTLTASSDTSTLTEVGTVGMSLNPDNQAVTTGKATLENKGTITLGSGEIGKDYSNLIGMQLERGTSSNKIESELINSGTINLKVTGRISGMTGILVDIHNDSNYVGKSLVKLGNINVYKDEYFGSGIAVAMGEQRNRKGLVDSNIIVDGSGGLITLEGEAAIGVLINRANKPQNSNNGMENIKNLNLLLNGKGMIGILREVFTNNEENAIDFIMTKDVINSMEFGGDSKNSVMFAPYHGVMVLDKSLKDSIGTINKGRDNAVGYIYTSNGSLPANYVTLKNYMPIVIESGAEGMMAFGVRAGGTIENYADIINNSSSYTENGVVYGAKALVSELDRSVMLNYGSIDMNGKNATAFYNGFLLNSESDHAIINNDEGVLIYSTASHRGAPIGYKSGESNISANKLEVNGDNGVVAFSNGGNITLSPLVTGGSLELTANGKNTYAFYHKKGVGNVSGQIKINGTVNSNIKNGGIGLHYSGNGVTSTPVNLGTELSKIIDSSGGNLNFITDSDSYNLTLQNTTVNLSNLSNLNFDNVTFTPDGKSKIFDSSLYVDIDSNIDKNNNTGNKMYRNTEINGSEVTINSGVTISGTEDSQIAIAQDFSSNYIWGKLSNKGLISLTGNKSSGIYGNTSNIENTGEINVSGKDTVGIYGSNSNLINTGAILVGDKGVGIYSEINPNMYYWALTTENDGRIETALGEGAVGIYTILNPSVSSFSNHELILKSNSDIDMRNSSKAVGIYTEKRNVKGTNSGKISIGQDSYGVYAKDSDVSLDNLDLNISGDNSVGIHTEGTGSFSGSGTVSIDGKGIIVLNIGSTGTYNQNFTANSTAGSSYIFQNIKNRTLTSDNKVDLGEGGTYINALDSAVTLGINSDLNSLNTSTGDYYSRMIGVVSSGGTGSIINKGKISFGDESAGLYARDGGQILNEGSINLGLNSVGLYGEGSASNIVNDTSGEINVKNNSVGILLNNGNSIVHSGKITGTGEKVTGIYSDSSNNTTIEVNGDINLTGNKSVGAYLSGTGSQSFANNAVISGGYSDSDIDPAIGIYNNSSTNKIINNNTVKMGDNSIGIYNNGGEVVQNSGNITSGKNSVGVYTDSGKLSLMSGSMNISGSNGVGIYAINGADVENNLSMNFMDNSYGIVVNSGSKLINNSGQVSLGENSVFIYSKGGKEILNKTGSDINLTGSNSSGIYGTDGVNIENHGNITADTGLGNTGVSGKGGNLVNTGNIKVGDSIIVDEENTLLNTYSIGVYGENTESFRNTGNIETGYKGVGLYIKGNTGEALNTGDIKSDKEGAIGIYAENSTVKNTGNITMSGSNSMGIAAAKKVTAINSGIITMNGDNSTGIYANLDSKIINERTGIININGNNSTGIQLSNGSTLENYGQINLATGITGSKDIVKGVEGSLPSLINGGVIKVDEKFEIDGLNLTIKVDPDSLRLPTLDEIRVGGYSPEDINAGYLISNAVSIKAPSFDLGGKAAKIDPNFTQGTNMRVYKFENVFDPSTPEGGPNTGEVSVESGSLTFKAIPAVNMNTGGIDIWMEKIDYNNFTKGSWQEEFSENIEKNYLNATGDALKIYDRIDLINSQNELNNRFDELAGSVYANMNEREQTIEEILGDSLSILENSNNNTKENVKLNVITGKGKTKEEADGVTGYDYTTTGVLALREVERTYRHTFGYSLGYLHTKFDFKDNINAEEKADTLQLGIHNKYRVNDWKLKTDITGRVSFHDMERSISWSESEKSTMSGKYETYSITSDNILGKEFELGKRVSVMPYGGVKASYITRPGFSEKGLEALEVEGTDAWSVKPRAGVELKGEYPLGSRENWKLKGSLDLSYEHELSNNNEEKAKLMTLEDNYHKLSKSKDEKGSFKTNATIGVEVEDRYGIFLTGEYKVGNHNEDDYRVGVTLKAVF